MLKLYEFWIERSKMPVKGKTPAQLRKELYRKDKKCYLCNDEKMYRQLELEHKIPIECGGHLWRDHNIALACKRCHVKKTRIDKLVIFELKRMKILISRGTSIVHLNELAQLYHKLFDLFKFGIDNYEIYDYGINGEDYEQIFTRENRK